MTRRRSITGTRSRISRWRALTSQSIRADGNARRSAILDLVPVIDRRLVINDRPADKGTRVDEGSAPLFGAIGELRRSRYDVAIDLQGLIKSAVLARASGAGRVIGFAASYVRERLARMFYSDAYDPGTRGVRDRAATRHVVDINLGLLTTLGLTSAAVEFPIDDVRSDAALAVAERTAGRYALLNPGAAWPNKRWPPANFGAVAAAIQREFGWRSLVLWGPGEQDLAHEVVAQSDGAAEISPPTTITDLVGIARSARLMISGDTGPLHIAGAVNTPIVALYGPTRPDRNGPWGLSDVSISRVQRCSCVYERTCRKTERCIDDISVAEVITAVQRRVAA